MTVENEHAGQGSVLLDIGGDVGALVVEMPAELVGQEVEIRPVDGGSGVQGHAHLHAHDGLAGHTHLPHVAVVARPAPEGTIHSAVFAELHAGTYELYLRPDGPVQLRARVTGGSVAFSTWE